jgi:lipopolysaccharide export system protein LptA
MMLSGVRAHARKALQIALAAGLVLLTTSFAPREAEADPLLDSASTLGKGDVGVQADKLEIDVATGSALLTGQVVLSKGDMAVKCPRVELKFDSSPHLNWAKGSGGVVADVRGVHGEAPEVELDLKKQILELRGGVKLSRGQGWIQADKATIELASGKVTATQVKGSIPVPKP